MVRTEVVVRGKVLSSGAALAALSGLHLSARLDHHYIRKCSASCAKSIYKAFMQ
jgi:hypothetical protein